MGVNSMNYSNEEFMNEVAKYAKKYAPKYGISLSAISAIVAQACLESGYGKSELSKYHNFFGLKYREGRVACHDGVYNMNTKEQLKDGSYIDCNCNWYTFDDIESGVEGYFQFINIPRYANLKSVDDPHQYLVNIRADGYATQLDYVDRVWRCHQNNNMSRFNTKEVTNMTISKLSVYNNITLDKSRQRPGAIVRLTPHCYVGQVTVKNGVDYLASKANASVNYVVDKDGKVGCNIPEDNGAWTSSSKANDEIAITFELACETTHPYKMNAECIDGFIELVVDICNRYNRTKVVYIADKNTALAYKPAANEFLITFHKWFSATACPGQWFLDNVSSIVDRINKKLQGNSQTVETPSVAETKYTIQLGAYYDLNNANKHANNVPGSFVVKIGDLYKLFIGTGTKAEMTTLKSTKHKGGFVTKLPANAPTSNETFKDVAALKVGDIVTLDKNATVYNSTRRFASWVYDKKLYVRSINGNRIVVSTLKEGAVTGAVDIKYIVR